MAVALCIGIIWIPRITDKALLVSLENKKSRIKDEFGLFSKDLVDVYLCVCRLWPGVRQQRHCRGRLAP